MSSNRKGYGLCGIAGFLVLCTQHTAFAQGNPDPCRMLTQAEISAATGSAIDAGQTLGGTCSWSGKPRVIVSLWYPTPAIFQGLQSSGPGKTITAAPGVGDAAFYATVGTFTSLGVTKGSSHFVIKVYGVPDPSRQMAIEKTLATNVL